MRMRGILIRGRSPLFSISHGRLMKSPFRFIAVAALLVRSQLISCRGVAGRRDHPLCDCDLEDHVIRLAYRQGHESLVVCQLDISARESLTIPEKRAQAWDVLPRLCVSH
jgi:hypothetical protein